MSKEQMPPIVRRVRGFFAPVDRVSQTPTLFDPAQDGSFNLSEPPAPWIDLGWIENFERSSGSVATPVRTGAPAAASVQVRTETEALVRLGFQSWGKLQLALASGVQQLNLLATQSGAATSGSGGPALPAVALGASSSANALEVGSASNLFSAGTTVVVDVDYSSGMTGYVGSGTAGAYVKTALQDVDYIRRVSLNVGRVASIQDGVLMLEQPLLAGDPTAGMKVSAVQGFCDREGSTFFQEWSALFVAEGQQGERVLWHYPRLQSASGIEEKDSPSPGGLERLLLKACFRALPVSDPCDGEKVVCFRSFLPA